MFLGSCQEYDKSHWVLQSLSFVCLWGARLCINDLSPINRRSFVESFDLGKLEFTPQLWKEIYDQGGGKRDYYDWEWWYVINRWRKLKTFIVIGRDCFYV